MRLHGTGSKQQLPGRLAWLCSTSSYTSVQLTTNIQQTESTQYYGNITRIPRAAAAAAAGGLMTGMPPNYGYTTSLKLRHPHAAGRLLELPAWNAFWIQACGHRLYCAQPCQAQHTWCHGECVAAAAAATAPACCSRDVCCFRLGGACSKRKSRGDMGVRRATLNLCKRTVDCHNLCL